MENYSIKDAFKALKDIDATKIKTATIKESIKSKLPLKEAKEKLKEGYLGQTLEDFLDVCIDSSILDSITLADNDEDDYITVFEGSYDELTDNLKNASFADFDCGVDPVVINAEIDGGGTDYYQTVSDFIDDYNGDDIEIDVDGEIVFKGDKTELPEDMGDYGFDSYDAPKEIFINIKDIDKEIEEIDESKKSIIESQSQEIAAEYERMSKKYGVNLDKLVDEFEKSNPHPEFRGDIIFNETL